jgi:proline iminopeptidase
VNGILYPELKPYDEGWLDVDPISNHRIFYQQFGNSDGIPVVYLHGGPGAGSANYFHRFFHTKRFRTIVYDQRGVGKSMPPAETQSNSPDALLEDNEKLREHLGIDKWHLFGGSWGSTLALLYAERYPQRVLSLTLRGVFLMRDQEIDWFMHHMGLFFPEVRREFEEFLPENERKELLESYYRRLIASDPEIHRPAALVWARYENGCDFRTLPPDADRNEPPDKALSRARIEAHFFRNHRLGNRILSNIAKVRHIPTMIVQGRYDIICPPATAYQLKSELNDCCLQLVESGHSAREPEIISGLIAAADRIAATAVGGSPGTPVLPTASDEPGL